MQHRRTRQSLLLQCILAYFYYLLKNIPVSSSAVSTGQCYHNIIETFTVFTLLLENLCMLKSTWQLSIILQWQAMCIMWIAALKCRCWTSFTGLHANSSTRAWLSQPSARWRWRCRSARCVSLFCVIVFLSQVLSLPWRFVKMNLFTIQWFL